MSLFPGLPQFSDPRSCAPELPLSLPEHLKSDLQGSRNPVDEPDFLANVIAAIVLEMSREQQQRIAGVLGYTEVT